MSTTPDSATTETALREHRPDLLPAYLAALPSARATVLARLWGAVRREPVPGVVSRTVHDGQLVCRLTDGRELTGPEEASQPFSRPSRLTVMISSAGYDDPCALLRALAGAEPKPPGADPPHPGGRPGPGTAVLGVEPALLDRLVIELANSVANLALARANQPAADPVLALSRLTGAPAVLEQCVVDGHPLHPGCRTRTGMSTVEVLRYAPEHRNTVELALVAVPARRFLAVGDWPGWLRADGHALLPAHPWQVEHVLAGHPDLVPTGDTLPGAPLMSLRTLAVGGAVPQWQVKTAVSAQMTSAVRVVSPAAVRTGPPLSALVAALAGRTSGLTVLRERAAGAVLLDDGQPSGDLSAVLREAPRLPAGHLALPAAALAAPSPATGRALLTDLVAWAGTGPHEVLANLVGTLLPPLLTLLDLGVALEAHGQNVLLVIHSGRIVGLAYRDFGGVRVSPARLRAHGVDAPPLRGDLVSDDPAVLRTKLVATVLSTVVAEVVATLAREYGEPPGTLWRTVAGALRGTAHALPSGARRILGSLFIGSWPLKATTAMRLAVDPTGDQWVDVPNPLEAT